MTERTKHPSTPWYLLHRVDARDVASLRRFCAAILNAAPVQFPAEVDRVFGHGDRKYGDGTWRLFRDLDPCARSMYGHLDAMRRADSAEARDHESGLLHLAHAVARAMILIWHHEHAARGVS